VNPFRFRPACQILSVLSLSAISAACTPGNVLGIGGNSGTQQYLPDFNQSAPAHRASQPCGDSDSSHLCIALKYVTYKDVSSGVATVSNAQAIQSISGVNSVWSQCHIQFFVESYTAVDARTYGLEYNSSTSDELQSVRNALADSNRLLIVTTGQWAGTLGAQAANAWTVMPPIGAFGSVLEPSVAGFPNLIAHELGHYLNLEHAADHFNVMNPVVYSNSLNIIDSQCSEARATAISFWGAALR
jgi:hypothetical protein